MAKVKLGQTHQTAFRALKISLSVVIWASTAVIGNAAANNVVVVGSKRFTESYILGEIVRQTLERQGFSATHKQGLGNTGILEQALGSGATDV